MLHLLPMVPDGEPVTDARFPDRWMLDRRVMTLPPGAFRTYVLSLTWAVSNRTDGHLGPDELAMVPGGGVSDAHRDLFVQKELWAKQADGYLILDFLTTQTSAAKLLADEEYAARERQRKRRPERASKGRAKVRAGDSAGNAHAEPQEDPGQDRDRTGREVEESASERFSGSDADHMVSPPLDRPSPFAVENEEWDREWGEAS